MHAVSIPFTHMAKAVVWAEQPYDDRWMFTECAQCSADLSDLPAGAGGFLWFHRPTPTATVGSVSCLCSRQCLNKIIDDWNRKHGITDSLIEIGYDGDDEP